MDRVGGTVVRKLIIGCAIVFYAIGGGTAIAQNCQTVGECAQQAAQSAKDVRDTLERLIPPGAVLAFNRPDCPLVGWKPFAPLAGRVIVGAGSGMRDQTGKALTARTVGQSGGEEAHVLTVDELAGHSHGYMYSSGQHSPSQVDHTPQEFGLKDRPNTQTSASGGNKAHNTMPPFYVLTYCERTN